MKQKSLTREEMDQLENFITQYFIRRFDYIGGNFRIEKLGTGNICLSFTFFLDELENKCPKSDPLLQSELGAEIDLVDVLFTVCQMSKIIEYHKEETK